MFKYLFCLVMCFSAIWADVSKEIQLPSNVLIEKGFEIVIVKSPYPTESSRPLLQVVHIGESFGKGTVIYSENESFKNLFEENFMRGVSNKKLMSMKTDYTPFVGNPFTKLTVSDEVSDNYTFEEIKSFINSTDFSKFNGIIKEWKEKQNKLIDSQMNKRQTWE